jgi:hypothetical protein
MSNYNLAESIHNKWLQVFNNKGDDLYVATVDDYIQAFIQVVAYHQFLKGGVGAMALAKRNSSFNVLNVVLNAMVTPLSYRRLSLIYMSGMNFVLVVPPPRCRGIRLVEMQTRQPHWG